MLFPFVKIYLIALVTLFEKEGRRASAGEILFLRKIPRLATLVGPLFSKGAMYIPTHAPSQPHKSQARFANIHCNLNQNQTNIYLRYGVR